MKNIQQKAAIRIGFCSQTWSRTVTGYDGWLLSLQVTETMNMPARLRNMMN